MLPQRRRAGQCFVLRPCAFTAGKRERGEVAAEADFTSSPEAWPEGFQAWAEEPPSPGFLRVHQLPRLTHQVQLNFKLKHTQVSVASLNARASHTLNVTGAGMRTTVLFRLHEVSSITYSSQIKALSEFPRRKNMFWKSSEPCLTVNSFCCT